MNDEVKNVSYFQQTSPVLGIVDQRMSQIQAFLKNIFNIPVEMAKMFRFVS